MKLQRLPDYQSLHIRSISLPKPKDCGNGWWCVEWAIMTDPGDWPERLHIPSPPPELRDMALVLTIVPRERGQIVVQTLTKSSRLAWNEIAYLSLVMQAIRALYRQVTIDGHIDHPILHISKP